MRKIDPGLHEQLNKLVTGMGYELVGAEILPKGRQMIFRIYIDGPKGVTIDDCSLVSHQVSAMLDVEDPFQGHYALEVSSPGIDRPLFELHQFERFVGSRVKLRLHVPINQRRQFKGILKAVQGDKIVIVLEDSEQEITVLFSAIEKANVVGDVLI